MAQVQFPISIGFSQTAVRRASVSYVAPLSPCGDLAQFFQDGMRHDNLSISNQFFFSVQIAERAIGEDASESMIICGLLYYPCQMLATRRYSIEPWNSDSLIESGTYDWLVDLAGEEIAESIRLQPHVRRYLASISPRYSQKMDENQRAQIQRDGGPLSVESRHAFAALKYFSPAMQLARWIDQIH